MSGPKILVVEDDAMVRKLVGVTLRTEGYRVVTADTAARALSLAAAEPPDLILLDLTLPDMDGLDLAARLRRLPDLEGVPLIGLSGLAPSAEETGRSPQPLADFLLKPVWPSSLLETVREHLAAGAVPGGVTSCR